MAIVFAVVSLTAASPRTFVVDPARSRATIDVGKSGAFSFAGHTHEIAAALRVTGKGESADDVPKVQQTMLGEQVLDAKTFPSITFESISVTGKGAPPALDLVVTGRLTIHGVTKTVTAPVSVKADGRSVTASGRFVIKQTEFGIKPVSVGGVVKVKDEL